MSTFVQAQLRAFNSCLLYFLLLEEHNDCIFWSKAANKSSGQKYFLKWPPVVLNYRVYLEEQKQLEAKLFRGYHSQFTLNYRRITQYECSVKYVQYSGTQSFHVEVKSIHAVRY